MDRLYDTKEAAEILGVKITTIQRWCRDNQIGFCKLGNLYRFTEKDLKARLKVGVGDNE